MAWPDIRGFDEFPAAIDALIHTHPNPDWSIWTEFESSNEPIAPLAYILLEAFY